MSYNPIGSDGVKALCDVLKFHGKIQTLKLGWCQVILRTEWNCMSSFTTKVFSPKLHNLQIGVEGAEYIADCLKYNTTLSTLDLRANGLGDDV